MATWSHNIVKQESKPWGIEVTVEFTRSGTGEVRRKTFRFDSQAQIDAEGASRLAHSKTKLELKYSILNDWNEWGEDTAEILRAGILAIRASPGVTKAQAVSWYDTNFPDAPWKGDKFFDKAKAFLRNELGYVPTWEQFKTYVINNQFTRIDG